MAVNIQVQNTLDQSAQYSYTSTNVTVGAGTIGVKNTNAFSANDAVQIGATGEEQSEIGIISSISGTALVLTGTVRFSHNIDTPIYNVGFDKIIVKRSTAGTAGTATALSSGTISITPDSPYTQYNDTTGVSTYAYKTSYYNSVSTSESSDSDWITPSGYQSYHLASIRQRIKNKLFDAGFFKDDTTLNDWINDWIEELNNEAIQVDQSYALGSVNVAFGTAGLGTITSSDFKEIKRLWVTYDGVTDVKAGHIDISGYWPNDVFSTNHPYYYNYGDNIFGIKPIESGGTAKIIYYKLQPKLVNDMDELPVFMKGYSKSFVDYCLGEAYYLDNKADRGDRYSAQANRAKAMFVEQITPRGKDDVQTIQFDYPVNEDDNDLYV